MTKDKKTPSQWAKDLLAFAKSGNKNLGKGGTPSIGTLWYTEYNNILNCKQHSSSKGIQTTLSFVNNTTSNGCSCKWHDNTNPYIKSIPIPRTNITQNNITSQPQTNNNQPVDVPFLIPSKPTPRNSIDDVKNKSITYKGNNVFDLTTFGFTEGSCPHCGKRPDTSVKLNKSIKLVHTLDKPRYVQGVGMKCSSSSCSGTWQSYEKGYVATLPKHKQSKLNAIIVGKSNGIDMGLVTLLRSGTAALVVERSCIANLYRWHDELRDDYNSRCEGQKRLGHTINQRDFPDVDEGLAAKQSMLMKAFIRDYLQVRYSLNCEMATIVAEHCCAIDHQHKVVQHAKGGDASQSFTVVSDVGFVLFYGAVPTDDMKWVQLAMEEIVERHGAILDPDNPHQLLQQGNLPKYIYVDKDCCNGKEGGRTDKNKFFYGMIKLLDAFHLILRIGREINSEHDRKAKFMRQLAQCIFTSSAEDIKKLDEARQAGSINDLNSRQKKYDRTKFVRRVIRDPKVIGSKILLLLKANIALDREARYQFEKAGHSCENLSPADTAYPLITKKVKKCIVQQVTHILNGCVSDKVSMNVSTGSSNYRGSGVSLPTYRSARGSSKCEVVHSVTDRGMYTYNNVRQITFDARLHWKITNMNRELARKLGKPALPDSVAPSEVENANIVSETSLRFGFDYCHRVLDKQRDDIHHQVMLQLDNDELTMDVDDYNIDSPDDIAIIEDDAATDEVVDNAPSTATSTLPINVDIPDEVDGTNIHGIVAALDDELALTTDTLPNVAVEDVDDIVETTTESKSTLAQCLNESNEMAAAGGIDLTTTGASETEQFTNLQQVKGRRNISLRKQQNQQPAIVTPSFNKQMEEKWISLWSDPKIGQPQRGNTTYYTWYNDISVAYETWRLNELKKAKEENRTPPPLYSVNFAEAKRWSTKMKGLSNLAHSTGVVNEATMGICANLDTVIAAVDDDNDVLFGDKGLGAAKSADNLQTHIQPMEQHIYKSPSSKEVNDVLGRGTDATDSEIVKLLNKEKNKKVSALQIDPALQVRIEAAAANMMKLGIRRYTNDTGDKKTLCKVCGQPRDFKLNQIPHRRMVPNGSKQFRFCPLADDHQILRDYLKQQEEKEKTRLKDKYESSRKRPRPE